MVLEQRMGTYPDHVCPELCRNMPVQVFINQKFIGGKSTSRFLTELLL